MEGDRHVEERGLSITPLLQRPERGNGTLFKHKRPRRGGPPDEEGPPSKHVALSVSCRTLTNWPLTMPKQDQSQCQSHVSLFLLRPRRLLRPPIRGGDSEKIFGQSSLAIFGFSKWSSPHVVTLHNLRGWKTSIGK